MQRAAAATTLLLGVLCAACFDALPAPAPVSASSGGSAGSAGAGGGVGILAGILEGDAVVRYYLDEAAAAGKVDVRDAAAPPTNLSFTPDPPNGNARYVSEGTGRSGILFPPNNLNNAPVGSVTQEILDLAGSTTLTIECVVDLSDAQLSGAVVFIGSVQYQSGLYVLGNATELSVSIPKLTNGDTFGRVWTVAPTLERVVLHLVLDSSLASANDRLRLYVDGLPYAYGPSDSTPPPNIGEGIDFGTASELMLGGNGSSSMTGTLYYLAIYRAALTPSEISNNHIVLNASDDTP